MSSAVGPIYAAYVLQKHELEANGILTHQMIKFTRTEDPARSPYVRLDNVTATALAEAIRRRIRGKAAYTLLDGCQYCGAPNRSHLLMLYAIPDVEGLDGLRFVSGHDGATRVLFGVLSELGCAYAKLSPDIRVATADRPAVWTLTVSEIQEYHELTLTPGAVRHVDSAEYTATAELHVGYVRLSEVLYLAEYTHVIGPAVVRNCEVPSCLGSRRTCEKFRFLNTGKTPVQVIREIRRRIGGAHKPLTDLWDTVVGTAVFFI